MIDVNEYYALLGLRPGATVAEIKKAYRIKALQYHPDRNQSSGASEKFVRISEAYQYLLNNNSQSSVSDADREKAYQAWAQYRREQARKRAEEYARASYEEFKKSELYKSSQAIDGRMIFFGFMLSAMIIIYTIYGYRFRVLHAENEREMPSVSLMLLSLSIGVVFLVITVLYYLAWRTDKKKEENNLPE